MPKSPDERPRAGREPQTLEAWESWVDRLILDAQERGEFDNLPGHGKPLELEDAPFAGGLEVGYGILKNAGVAPYWVELEKEIRAATAAMETLLARAVALAGERDARTTAPAGSTLHRWGRWRALFGGRRAVSPPAPIPAARRHALAIGQLRREYREHAAALERAIGQYNAAIPRDLWWLERPRETADAAVTAFDHAVATAAEAASRTQPFARR